jgi:hypothetical protein
MGDFERMPRDVLTMLRVELRQAKEGTWTLHPNQVGVDVDLVEMFEETIAEIERLRSMTDE